VTTTGLPEITKRYVLGPVFILGSARVQLRVEKIGNELQLYFYGEGSNLVISRMDVQNPLNLVSPYTQAMMLALL